MSPTARDPLREARRTTAAWAAAALVVVAGAAAWGLGPVAAEDAADALVSPPTGDDGSGHAAEADGRGREPLDFAALREVDLWPGDVNDPAAEEESPERDRPPPPPDLQLVGIVLEHGTRKAALYRRNDDRLLVLGAGETDGGLSVTRVEATEVELAQGDWVGKLRLEDGPRHGADG
ncbi:MAG: hypothetical protein ACF8XB_11090 [Planctomycetota bacterium JB042]